ncbi:Imm1 family immunity protein [Kitasatospora sp. NPDC094016]|uniref:Imm1 family immunity protein n=1 Tax=Kitasatospora sp. NPDC094016 TaxID=3154986 RepID=UPI00332A77D9
MILNAVINREWHYAESWAEMESLIDEVINSLELETFDPYWTPGDDACFMFSDRRHSNDTSMPNNFLRIAVNSKTGFGGLIWFVGASHPAVGWVYDHTWVSDNQNPPDFDPRVISDPGEPRFHNRRSAIPLPDVRNAVEEFCRTGTGDRPDCIHWVPGHANGYRLDEDDQ